MPEFEKEPDVFEVWKCSEQALRVFLQCATQWNVVTTMNGVFRTGLDYTAVRAVMELMVEDRSQWLDILRDIRSIESGALTGFSKVNH
ncbi:DUF1799 domain-containing protein [Pseudomaricurvus alkylphenolicus]|uniref:DUF1799 domain-containing protein n=1 Tax=Pseudomaricurvus alkylphenolicus TaxID=1306991 RepID=UPI00141FB5EF|nr:DUF1799 domain-containing protein [Pseudomaricurvus alkylphenolicus]NIB44814.1 DUF1799 domain-containing protein [Pseudomaricurvus alkylphenolicus]